MLPFCSVKLAGMTTSDDGIEAPGLTQAEAIARDRLELELRRPDLTEAQRSELYAAAFSRLRYGLGGPGELTTQADIFAWIDMVTPPDVQQPIQQEVPAPAAITSLFSADAHRLLLGPNPAVSAAPLAALAQRRPDLSHAQRHELFVAAWSWLSQPKGGTRVQVTPDAVFAWIDVIVPVRPRPINRDAPRTVGRPKGSRYIPDRQAVVDAYRRAKRRQDRNPSSIPSLHTVAEELGVSRTTLAAFLRAEGIPWPPE
jgi:hypothetical protein